jgi:hypothetical protein
MHRRICVFALALLLATVGCNSSKSNTATSTPDQQQASSAPAPGSNTMAPGNEPANSAAAPAAVPAPAPPPPEPPKPIVVPAGTSITVRLAQALGSKSSQTGDSFAATVTDPISVGGEVVIPAASTARGTVVEAKAKGKVKGEARLKLALNKITVGGDSYTIATSMSATTAKGKGKRTAATTGGGAAAGAIIGAIAGGGKGAAIGALVGGGAGFAGGALTGNSQIELPAETVLTFKLTESLTIQPHP